MNEASCNDPFTDKALRLIDYLLALTSLRSPLVRDLESYQGVLWLHEIPHERGCFTQAWGRNEEYGLDVWIEIRKDDEPVLQDVPKLCEQWVDHSTLYQTGDLPRLYPEITVQVPLKSNQAEPNQIVTETRSLKDFPEVERVWERYLDENWLPWMDLHRKWQAVQKVYAQLFTFHQEQQRVGEEYELVLGLGLLRWRNESGHTARRHLITAKASLQFEASLGLFTVGPAADGAKLTVELDMLDVQEQPPNIQQLAMNAMQGADDDPWDRSIIDPVLTGLAKALHNLGEYHSDRLEPQPVKASEKPIVEIAPALILRKRSLRGLQEALYKMRQQVALGTDIPSEFRDLCEIRTTRELQLTEGATSEVDLNPTIYFPKPFNEEQKQIIEKLRSTNGVLVQGPPGTGKSHTIANLICHLLSNGKRVLVTAQTPRALLVLQDKLPAQLQPLCINLLGSGIDEQTSLEASVSGILAEQDQWNEQKADRTINALTQKIHSLQQEKAANEFRLRSIREADTRHHAIISAVYTGTAAQIARQLVKEASQYGWFKDKVRYDQEMLFAQSDFQKLREVFRSSTLQQQTELQGLVPNPAAEFVSSEILEELFQRENEIETFLNSHRSSLIKCELGIALERIGMNKVNEILDAVSSLAQAIQSIGKRPMRWIERAVFDVLSDRDTPWKELQRLSIDRLKGLKEKVHRMDRYIVEIPASLSRRKLLNDARALKWHFDQGGDLGWGPLWGPFRPRAVKDNWHIIENVRIDGLSCSESELVSILVEYLFVEEQLEYAWKQWMDISERPSVSMIMQVAELEELLEALNLVLGLLDYLRRAKSAMNSVNGIGEPAWYDQESIKTLIEICNSLIAKKSLTEVRTELGRHESQIKRFCNQTDAHPLTHSVFHAIQTRDLESYRRMWSKLSELHKLAEVLEWAKCAHDELEKVVPCFARELRADPNDTKWLDRLKSVEQAWTWSRAQSWLQDFIYAEDMPSLERRIKQIENEIRNAIAHLSAALAWKFFFRRLSELHRRHLMAWQQAINKLGKGTGKYAPKHRRDAQSHLNECREAVPAWIMPLHRVWETVDPVPGMFDVVIVDEASQCGPEALPLTYLGKKIIVVGDDQQISPEAVGIGRDAVHRLIHQFLYDFDHGNSFDVDTSLFDQAKRRFSNRVVLREHFRCMPEIIRFSNDLCYEATPLIPLRQYPPNRLEPLKSVHVPSGYREGMNQRVINKPEAEVLVETVVQCCNDDRYEGKTMGVIILQGEAQAKLIESMLLSELGAEEMEARRIVCGNPYSFQGDERHIMFLSMVAAPNERIGPFTSIADRKRFNVAASRAQDQMWLFHTATRSDLNKECLRRRLLEHFENPTSHITRALGEDGENLREIACSANRQVERPPSPFDSWFEVDVALRIAARGYRVIPQYPFGGKSIDLVIEGLQSQLAVECDGDFWHGPEHYERDTGRQRILERCGWHFHRIRECMFNADSDAALEPLWKILVSRGIHPTSGEPQPSACNLNEQSSAKLIGGSISNDEPNTEREKNSQKSGPLPQTALSGQQYFPGFTSSTDEGLSNVHEAIAMKPSRLRDVIVDVLRRRPNRSCQKEALTAFVLKALEIVTRGEPRKQFERKVIQAVGYLKTNGVIREYKTPKNIRIKLVNEE
jgi:very-short-patch-repair endonuclease